MKTINVTIVSAEKELYSGDVQFFAATAITGEIGVYPNHMPILTLLKPGQVRLTLSEGKEEVFWISGGILEVQPEQIIVLADSAERAEALDTKTAEEAMRKAEELISARDSSEDFDYEQAQTELSIARSQLDALNRLKQFK